MNLLFKPRDMNPEYLETLVRWYNDPEIRDFLHPNFTEKPRDPVTVEDVRARIEQESPNVTEYLIFDKDRLIGECSITLNFPFLVRSTENTAWISLCIGAKDLWGKGVATQTMAFLEQECRRLGQCRIELGVFEQNTRARNLYAKMGYREITRIEHFTYDAAGWHADLRMEKIIERS